MSGHFPRCGFLHESRSSPLLGPPPGKPHSPRFAPLPKQAYMATQGYNLPDPSRYRKVGSAQAPRLGPGPGKPLSARIDPAPFVCSSDGPNKFYDWKLKSSESAPTLGPGLGRPSSPRSCDLALPTHGAHVQYDLPAVDVYKPRTPGALHWDAKRPRFDEKLGSASSDERCALPSGKSKRIPQGGLSMHDASRPWARWESRPTNRPDSLRACWLRSRHFLRPAPTHCVQGAVARSQVRPTFAPFLSTTAAAAAAADTHPRAVISAQRGKQAALGTRASLGGQARKIQAESAQSMAWVTCVTLTV